MLWWSLQLKRGNGKFLCKLKNPDAKNKQTNKKGGIFKDMYYYFWIFFLKEILESKDTI